MGDCQIVTSSRHVNGLMTSTSKARHHRVTATSPKYIYQACCTTQPWRPQLLHAQAGALRTCFHFRTQGQPRSLNHGIHWFQRLVISLDSLWPTKGQSLSYRLYPPCRNRDDHLPTLILGRRHTQLAWTVLRLSKEVGRDERLARWDWGRWWWWSDGAYTKPEEDEPETRWFGGAGAWMPHLQKSLNLMS